MPGVIPVSLTDGSDALAVARSSQVAIEPVGDIVAARGLWERLEQPTGNPFSSWLFADVWWRHLGAGRPLRLSAVRVDDEVIALLPLFDAGAELRFLGHGDADLLAPIGDAFARTDALAVLGDDVARGGARLIADEVAEGSARWLGGEIVRRTPSPVLDLPDAGFEALLAARSANLRGAVRNRENRLTRAHSLRVRAATAATLARDLETLFALHNARWSGTTSVFSGARVAMHRELARRALERGWLRLRLLELDDRPVAATYGLRVGDAEWYYQAGRDPAFDRASVGSVLFAASIRAACEEGAREYRMLRGDQRYKLSWATRDAPLETVLVEGS
jgi:CelD/BcsL family acetyltransferase involved in cellulose biosynthesis